MTAKTRKLAPALRKMARDGQYGHSRTLRDFFISESYGSYSYDGRWSGLSFPEWVAAARLLARYQRLVNSIAYAAALRAEWKQTNVIYYMDNSTEIEQTDKDGNRRRIMVKAPSGDVC